MSRPLAVLTVLVMVSFVALGCGMRNAASGDRSEAQALRTCVDRWNQGNMLGWGPTLVNISIRRLDAARLDEVGLRNPALSRCVVSLAVHFRRDPTTGCSGAAALPGDPAFCVDRSATYNCVINRLGAYGCPTNADTLRTPLRKKNATTDKSGVLRTDNSLPGTHPTPPLAWQRRYPHVDGLIEPWTGSGRLRPGIAFTSSQEAFHGRCSRGSFETRATSALFCGITYPQFGRAPLTRFDPCFPQTADWNYRGALVACARLPGDTTFDRFVISKRS